MEAAGGGHGGASSGFGDSAGPQEVVALVENAQNVDVVAVLKVGGVALLPAPAGWTAAAALLAAAAHGRRRGERPCARGRQ